MKLSEYKAISKVTGVWSFLVWFIKTKEFKWVLMAVIIILIYNPDWLKAIKEWIINFLK